MFRKYLLDIQRNFSVILKNGMVHTMLGRHKDVWVNLAEVYHVDQCYVVEMAQVLKLMKLDCQRL